MSKNKYTDLFCVVLSLAMLLALFLFCNGERLGLEKVSRQTQLSESAASASAVIVLSDEHIKVKGTGAYAADGVVNIAYGGEYTILGSLSNGRIVVDTDSRSQVKLIFSGADIHCETGAAVWVKNAGRTTLSTAAGTENFLSCGESFDAEHTEADVNAAVYAQDDLVLNGKGSMTITAPGHHGITAKDDLKLKGGAWEVIADGDGIRGKDSVECSDGSYLIRCGGDGVQSYNDADEGKGSVEISGGSFCIDAGRDGIQAFRDLTICGGSFDITTGGGAPEVLRKSQGWIDKNQQTAESESVSCKGLKCGSTLTVSGGEFLISSSDDTLHCDNAAIIEGGSFTVATADDALHANESLAFRGGSFTVLRCIEGLEARQIEISGGEIDVTSLDDGINANGQSRGVNMSRLLISGGTVKLFTQADGLDSNGDITITGGHILISAEPSNGNSAVDYGIENGGDCLIHGGSIVACGFAGMAESFSESSTQCSLLYIFEETLPGGTEVTLADSSGRVLLSHVPENDYDCVIFSCPELELGEDYTVSAAAQVSSVTLEERAQRVGSTFGDRTGLSGFRPDGKGGRDGFAGQPPEGGFGELPRGGFGGQDGERPALPEGEDGAPPAMPEDGSFSPNSPPSPPLQPGA